MSKALASVIALVILTSATAATADPPPNNAPPTISVNATGSVDYVPDIVQLTLGARVESATAQAATNGVNQRANQIIAALRSAGINQRSIKTTSFNLGYRENPAPTPAEAPPANGPARTMEGSATQGTASPAGTGVVARLPLPGVYVASETLEVTAPVRLGGKALDVAIGAGANESFGLTYQTSNTEALYRAALAKAFASARDSARAIADAAHLSISGIQSISTNGSQPVPLGAEPMMMRSMSATPVLPGTQAVTATVFVVYKIR